MHSTTERLFWPAADACLGMRGNVRGEDGAERGRHRQAASEALSAAHGVAIAAIADRGKFTAPPDQIRIKRFWRRRIDGRYRRPPDDRERRDGTTNYQDYEETS